MKLLLVTLTVMALAGCSNRSQAQLEDEILAHPDPSVVDFYRNNLQPINELRSTIEASSSEAERVSALVALEKDFPLASEITARQYVSDRSDVVALESIQILKGNLVMSDHRIPHDSARASPRLQYMHKKHVASKRALRRALTDERTPLRIDAAGFLASLSDEASLEEISKGVESGLYSQVEAANLYTLSSGQSGEKHLQAYVGTGNLDAQRTAIAYLGSNPEYQPRIREAYFLNGAADTQLRVQAAKTLSTYDTEFIDYGQTITEQRNVDPALFEATVDGLIKLQNNRQGVDPNEARLLLERTRAYTTTRELSDDDRLRLDTLEQRLESIATE